MNSVVKEEEDLEVESAMEETASAKAEQVRETLVALGLSPEVIKQALLKIDVFDGDLNAIATHALSLNTPQAECIEDYVWDDMNSSDEDAGVPSGEERVLPSCRAASPLPVQVPDAHEEEEWQDPICKLFQEPSMVAAKMEPEDTGPEDSEPAFLLPTPPLLPEHRELSFLDMGFSKDLVQRAIRHHSAETADSILLQFLLDNSEHGTKIGQRIAEEDSDSEEELRVRVQQNIATRDLKCSTTSTYRQGANIASDSESDSDIAPCNYQKINPSDFANPSPLCSREADQDGGLRDAMRSAGFSSELIERAVQELGEAVEYDMLLDYLLFLANEQDPNASSNEERDTFEKLTKVFQFPPVAVEKAMVICKTTLRDAKQEEIAELVDFLAAHMDNLVEGEEFGSDSDCSSDDLIVDREGKENYIEGFDSYHEEKRLGSTSNSKGKRKLGGSALNLENQSSRRGRPRILSSGSLKNKQTASVSKSKATIDTAVVCKYRGSIGFGLPGQPQKQRSLQEDVKGAPFFYFENVAGMPVGEWDRIVTHLFGIEPEFVDSMHFSACRRSRGYIHNLPLEGRRKIIKDPPMTIQELMPQTVPFWPEWDKRTKLNCINTVKGTEFILRKLGIEDATAIPTAAELVLEEQTKYSYWCRKMNLVWTSPSIPTPIEANEIEAMLGFDRDHTRCILNTSIRYKALGNSFSVYTVAYHFSVLKPLFPRGIKVLSLFSGIGGAEVALHKIGIKLNVVVSVEIELEPRRCLQTWWSVTNQTGHLDVEYHDVRHLTKSVLTRLVNKYQGFDLIVGGSPCNNFAGSNRVSRIGLEGGHSTMFFEFSRIVVTVRDLTVKLLGR